MKKLIRFLRSLKSCRNRRRHSRQVAAKIATIAQRLPFLPV